MASDEIAELQAIVAQQQETIENLQSTINQWRLNGAEDMFGGAGYQRYSGGTMRLDGVGIQILPGSNESPAIFFLEEFETDSTITAKKATIEGSTGPRLRMRSVAANGAPEGAVRTYADSSTPKVELEAFLSSSGDGPFVQLYKDASDKYILLDRAPLAFGFANSDYSSVSDGEMWYRNDIDKFRVRIDGATYNLAVEDALVIGDASELTISSGAITITGGYHLVDTEGDAANDDLDTINGGVDGQVLVLSSASNSRTVTARDGNGNLALGGNATLNSIEDTLTLIYSGGQSQWLELSRSNNG